MIAAILRAIINRAGSGCSSRAGTDLFEVKTTWPDEGLRDLATAQRADGALGKQKGPAWELAPGIRLTPRCGTVTTVCSHAVEGVCDMLSHEKRVSLLLDAVRYQPSAPASQLVFKVGLMKKDAGRKYSSVSVRDGEAFARFWPRQPKLPTPKAADR